MLTTVRGFFLEVGMRLEIVNCLFLNGCKMRRRHFAYRPPKGSLKENREVGLILTVADIREGYLGHGNLPLLSSKVSRFHQRVEAHCGTQEKVFPGCLVLSFGFNGPPALVVEENYDADEGDDVDCPTHCLNEKL